MRDAALPAASAAVPAFAGLLALLAILAPDGGFAACVTKANAPATAATPAPEPALYSMTDQIYSLGRALTLYYYFQGYPDGAGKMKKEIRYSRNLWDTCAQLQIRLPFITRYPIAPNPYSPNADPFSGLGNAELRYSYNVVSKTLDHSLTAGVAFPTETNGVQSNDTELKFLYATRWKWTAASLAYSNEYDQTVIRPPGARSTSFYEGKLSLPDVAFIDSPAARGIKISAIYNFRVLFNRGGIYQSAIGGVINGNVNDVALNLVDTWGIGAHGLWKYRFESSAVVRL